jgi:hypothetical protein
MIEISFVIDNGISVPVPYDTANRSELVKTRISIFSETSITIIIPQKFHSVISNYINFLTATTSQGIIDADKLKQCFYLESFLHDTYYFKYLMQQTLDNWSLVSPTIYTNLNPDIQREVYLHCPYGYVPSSYMNKPFFFKEWSNINNNTVVKINSNSNNSNNSNSEQYHTIVNYYSNEITITIKFHQMDNGSDIGFVRENTYYQNGCYLKRQKHYLNGKRYGMWSEWSDGKYHRLWYQGQYVNDKHEGIWKWWHDNDQHTLASIGKYSCGLRKGRWIRYNHHGDISFNRYYVDGFERLNLIGISIIVNKMINYFNTNRLSMSLVVMVTLVVIMLMLLK